ncbi:HD domain-containing protein [Butyrivibrio sp. XBB1001]|uniref:HD domain-containing protein n=1 Tax=Butyrivibrio sp. XBB1001 TaxID=1280682 RepID=UPI000402FC16|nr:HD domain-containing protein [Butyrivibrio sp. XBB1001]
MLKHKLIEQTEDFLKKAFEDSLYLNAEEHLSGKKYRLEHTYRVANIGLEIARKEGFDETEMVIACLLHDISYCEDFGENGWIEHGRRAAQLARPFLAGLGLPEDRVNDICYGIAIHVDDKADFEGERTPFALSVGDADNIDRFDVYRIHEILSHDGFLGMEYEQKRDYAQKRLEKLREIIDMPLGTKAAEELWKSRLSFYIQFFEKLVSQIENSKRIK